MTKRNPWDIDEDAIERQEKENKTSMKGVLCPKMNYSIRGICYGCNYIQDQIYNKNYPDEHPAKKWASAHNKKVNIFFNVVFSDNRDTPIVINLKNEAGSYILKQAKTEWKDILNPHKGKGRELVVKKVQESGRKYPSYTISPVLEKADWEIPEEVWKDQVFNLDQSNLIKALTSSEFTDDNYFDVSSMKVGESKKFRVLPCWQNGEKKESNDRFAEYVWRHWGLSEEQVNGKEPISWEGEVEDNDDVVDEPSLSNEKVEVEEQKVETKEKVSPEKTIPCFGKKNYFNEEDEICMECGQFKACAKAVMG